MRIKIKRIYDPAEKGDGYRILVDRLWPRGIKKQDAKIDLWLKDVAPSTELRKWFNHEEIKWSEFKSRYHKELATKQDLIQLITDKAHSHMVTLLYSAKDVEHNNAVELLEYINRKA